MSSGIIRCYRCGQLMRHGLSGYGMVDGHWYCHECSPPERRTPDEEISRCINNIEGGLKDVALQVLASMGVNTDKFKDACIMIQQGIEAAGECVPAIGKLDASAEQLAEQQANVSIGGNPDVGVEIPVQMARPTMMSADPICSCSTREQGVFCDPPGDEDPCAPDCDCGECQDERRKWTTCQCGGVYHSAFYVKKLEDHIVRLMDVIEKNVGGVAR
jgi:hypothetical protein